MNKVDLYLDLDDTVFDTENFLRKKLGGSWLQYEGLLYEAYEEMDFSELVKVLSVFKDYRKIPLVNGAKEGLNILKDYYNIIFCSSYHLDPEKKSKQMIADLMGFDLILCGGDDWDKSHIDMSKGVFVDDNTRLLNKSNASKKVCFYKRFNMVEEFKDGKIVFSWAELLEELCPEEGNCV